MSIRLFRRRPVPSYAPMAQTDPIRSRFYDPRVISALAILALFTASKGH